jgi:hypothetical protein
MVNSKEQTEKRKCVTGSNEIAAVMFGNRLGEGRKAGSTIIDVPAVRHGQSSLSVDDGDIPEATGGRRAA